MLLILAGLALWYALGVHGGLAPLLASLPLVHTFRFPSKAMLLPHLSVAILAGLGLDRLRRGEGWVRFAAVTSGLGALIAGVATAVTVGGVRLAGWAGVAAERYPQVAAAIRTDCAWEVVLGLGALLTAGAVRWGSASPRFASGLVGALAVFALVRAGAFFNPQTSPSFFAPLPEIEALRLSDPGVRVFSYGVDHSPSFRAFLARSAPDLRLASFFVNRQLLAPYNNVLDRVAAAEATDLTSFVPRPRELAPADYDPRSVAALLPWLRNAAVTHVLSLDPLEHPDLEPLAGVPAGAGLTIHAYGLHGSWPRAFVACRSVVVPAEMALGQPYRDGFRPDQDVALEEPAPAACGQGRVTPVRGDPVRDRYSVEVDGPALLVLRDSFARGWSASVDGRPSRVLRANGKHRAVPVPAGTHVVELGYRPPGLRGGVLLASLSALALGALGLRARTRGRP